MASSILNYYLTLLVSVLVFVKYGLTQNIYSNIHSEMSLDEIRDIFHVDSHHQVPEYEVINIHHLPQESSPTSIDDPLVAKDILENSQSSHQSVTIIKPDPSFVNRAAADNSPKILFAVNTSSVDIISDSSNNNLSELNKSKYPKKTYANYDQLFNKKKQENVVKIVESNKFINGDQEPQIDSEQIIVPLDNGERVVEESIQLEAFGRKLNLQLKPTEGLIKKGGLKLFMVEPNVTSQHGVDYVEVQNEESEEHVGNIYQDEQNQAAVLLRPDPETGKYLMEGNIGKDLVIKPLPKHLRKAKRLPQPDLSDDELFLNQDDLNSEVSIDTGLPIRRNNKRSKRSVNLQEHVIYKRKLNEEEYYGDYAFMEPDRLGKRYRRTSNVENVKDFLDSDFESIEDGQENNEKVKSRRKREAPYVIYPEILVIVDYDGYRLHGGDNLQIKRYFVSFWNGVDLRYKLLKGPRVRISIAGIIISRGRDATPYLERNRVGRDAIDSAAALTDMGKYLFKERRLPVYDIAVAITKLDMCRRQFANDVCNRGTAGFAYVGGACVVNKRLEKVNSVAIIEDTGGFSGIIVAAHEVGHLLGAVHDGSPPPSYLGGPGAEKCRWEDGYIMSDLRHTERGFRWSPCSIQSFHHFLNGDTATCLYNSPHEDESLGRVLPGKLLTLDAQCRRDRGTSACFKDDRVCAQLFCFDSGSGYCVAYRPAAEGSPCGDGQYCINGRCVVENENIIPDYSQSSQYLRRSDDDFDYQNTASTELRSSYITTQRYYPPTTTTTTTEATTTPDYYSYYRYYQQQLSQETTENYYNYYSTYTEPTTTQKSYYQHQYYTTKPPYRNYNYYSSGSSSPATIIKDIPITTTQKTPKKGVDTFHISTTTLPPTTKPTTTTRAPQSTTKNPYVGDYYERLSRTTKSPYDWANIGRFTTTSNPNAFNGGNNYLKRSSNYYSASEQHEHQVAQSNSTIQQRHTETRPSRPSSSV